MGFSAQTLTTTVRIYSIDKPAQPHEIVEHKPEACVNEQYLRASNPVGEVMPRSISSTLVAFRRKGFSVFRQAKKSVVHSEGCGFFCPRPKSTPEDRLAILYKTTVSAMSLTNPYGTAKPCLGCEHFGGFVADGACVKCVRGPVLIQADPARGCVYWVRAIGADDEPDAKLDKRRAR